MLSSDFKGWRDTRHSRRSGSSVLDSSLYRRRVPLRERDLKQAMKSQPNRDIAVERQSICRLSEAGFQPRNLRSDLYATI